MILFLARFMPIVAEGENEIHIQTAQDLCDLARNCALDTWSQGKVVMLDNDISLAGTDFTPIPIFNGIFDGGGHEIADLELLDDISPYGFILETGKDAEIRLLTVNGKIEPTYDSSKIGGIVGINRGLIIGCTFNGTLSGKDRVGSIVGVNESSGVISSCRSFGTVFALGNVGGIAGENKGAIGGCDNSSYVNTKSIDPSLQLDAIDTSSLTNLIGSLTTENADICTDIGGIAGSNDGIIELCSNHEVVGYLHLGSNIGGIAGRNSGFINRCHNDATIYGRRNTGGIVGRAEPLIEVTKGEDLIEGLGYRVETLNASIDIAVQDAGNSSNDLAYRLDQLHGYVTPLDFALTGSLRDDFVEAQELRASIKNSIRGITDELQNISAGIDAGSATLNADIQTISYNANALSDAAMQALTILSTGENMEGIITDASLDSTSIAMGKVADSVNEGTINADRNVGGIAGIITIEENPDIDNLSGGDNRLTQNKYNLRCVITDCINRGVIAAKNECVGGIAGRMDFGLASRCEGYGEVSLEDGDYAGGICGLSYGNIRNCFAKCTLSAKRYVGGILGNGYSAQTNEEQNSETTDCYALVEILGNPRFAAAISGGANGTYANNRFCSNTYTGLDKINIQGMAEQVDFDSFAQNVPEECHNFTLTFVVDGEIVKTIPFSYGDSFGEDVFPDVQPKNGMYPSWDKTDLTNLTFDTTVTATYRMNKTVLDASLPREDGRMAVYVDGLFKQDDAMSIEQLPINKDDEDAFHTDWLVTMQEQIQSMIDGHPDYTVCTSVVEKLLVTIPNDGELQHQIRYLPPKGYETNCRLFLLDDNGWQRLETESFGSYLVFPFSGTQAQIALVQTIQSWWIIAYAIIAIVLIILLASLVRRMWKMLRNLPKRQKKPIGRKKTLSIAIASSICLILLVISSIFYIKLEPGLSVGKLIKDFAKEETAIHAEITVDVNDKKLPISTTALRVNNSGKMITYADAFGIPLYFHDGEVYLENGRSFKVRSHLDQGTIISLVQKIFSASKIEKQTDNGIVTYHCEMHDDTAEELLAMFLGNTYQETLHAQELSMDLIAAKGNIQQLLLTGKGKMESGTPFEVHAKFVPETMTEHPVIPQAVLDAMSNQDKATEILTEDMLALFAGWMKFDESENIDATISLMTDAGPLSINTDCTYFRQKIAGNNLHCISTPLLTTYFTDHSVYSAEGQKLINTENRNIDVAKLIDAAHELSLAGKLSCERDGDNRLFTIELDASGAEKLAETLLPQLQKELPIYYGDNVLSISLEDGNITSISYQCMGTIKIVTKQLNTQMNVSINFIEAQTHDIPQAIQDDLSN